MIYHIVFLLFIYNFSFAQSEIISDFNLSSFSNSSLKFFYNKSLESKFDKIDTNKIELYENNIRKNVSSISNFKNEAKKLSIVIALDISSSMQENLIELSKKAITKFLNSIDLDSNEIAFITFNQNNYLNKDFTNNKSSLISSLNLITSFGGTNFNSALLNEPAGAILVSNKSRFKKIVFLITDGNAEADIQKIIKNANDNNIVINSFALKTQIPKVLEDISKATDGKIFSNIDTQNKLTRALVETTYLFSKSNYLQLNWNSYSCDTSRNLQVFIKDNSQIISTDSSNFRVDEKLLPRFIIDKEFFDFGILPIGTNQSENYNIVATNSKIKIDSIFISNPRFSIKGIKPNDIIMENESAKFQIQYSVIDTLFSTCKIIIFPDFCKPTQFELTAGSKDKSDGSNTLKLLYPNGNEKLSSSAPIELKWDTKSNQILNLEFSSNSGKNWESIYKSITGNSVLWNLPNIESNSCLVKVSKPTNSNLLENVTYLKYNNLRFNLISWSNQSDKLVTSNSSGELLIWDVFKSKIPRILAKDLIYTIALEWSPTTQLIASSFESTLSGFDILLFDAENNDQPLKLKGNTSKALSLSWNSNGSYLCSGLRDGTINIWDISKPNLVQKQILNAHIGSISTIAWNPQINFIASAGSDRWIKIWNSVTGEIQSDSLVISDDVNKIVWTPNGKSLVVASENKNILIYTIFDELNQYKPNLRKVINREGSDNQKGNIKDITISKDGKFIITISDTKVNVWNIETGDSVFQYNGHLDFTSSVSINSNNFIASCSSNDRTIQVWSIKDAPFNNSVLDIDISDTTFSISKFNASLSDLNFGSFCVGKELDSTFNNLIINKSNSGIIVDSLVINGVDKNEFAINTNFPTSININEKLNVSINFHPKTEGIKKASLKMYVGKNILTSEISAFGIKPVFEIINQFVNFGKVNIQDEMDTIVVSIKNYDTKNINLINSYFTFQNPSFELLEGAAPKTLAPQDSLKIKIRFSPKELGRQSEILRFVTEASCTPIEINLFGEGSQPEIRLIDSLNFSSLLCENIKEMDLVLLNSGFSKVRIDTMLIEGLDKDNFTLSALSNKIIDPNQSPKVKITFHSNGNNQQFKATFKIKTLKPFREFSCNLFAIKDSLSTDLTTNQIEMVKLNVNTIASSTFGFKNTSNYINNYSININNPFFKLTSSNTTTLKPNQSYLGNFEFIGFLKDTLITANLEILDFCNFNHKINLLAEVGSITSLMEVDSVLYFSKVHCNEKQVKKLTIKNIGNFPLIINSIDIQNQNSFFSINENLNGTIISKNSSATFGISFNSNSSGSFTDKIIIKSNSQKPLIEVNVYAFVPKYSFKFDLDTLFFNNLNEFEIGQNSINIINESEDSLIWDFPITIDNYFVVDSIVPKNIVPNSSAKIYMTFKGNSANTSNEAQLVLNSYCANSAKLNLKANTRGEQFIILTPQNFLANSGESFNLKFKIDNPKSLDLLTFKEISTTLKFNSTLLIPNNMTLDTIINNNSYLKLKIPIEKLIDNTFSINFLATLGDTSSTSIELTNSTHLGNQIYYIKEKAGSFNLTNICYEGGGRYIVDYGKLILEQNNPNPTDGLTKFKFSLIEKGETKLEIYNDLGQKVMTLVEGVLLPKSYEINADLNNLSIGIYIYLLKTPSQSLLRKLIILK